MNIILKIKEILNSNDTEKKIVVVFCFPVIIISSIIFIFYSFRMLFNYSIVLVVQTIFLGTFDSSFILVLLMIINCKKHMTGRNRRGIPITKDNIIYARILVCLVPGFFVLYGTLGLILESNSKILCIFLICFATIIGCGMLYGINKSIEDED